MAARPPPARWTPPRPPAVVGGEDRSQRPDRPAVLVVGEAQRVEGQSRGRGRNGPRAAAVGRVQHAAPGRAGQPAVRAADGHGGEVEQGGRVARESGGRIAPLPAQVRGEQEQPAVAGQPGGSRTDEAELADRLQSGVAGAGELEIAVAEHAELTAAAGQHARPLVEKIAGQPAVAAAAADRASKFARRRG